MRPQIENRKSKIIIVGGGPAGSSLAIRLARNGFETVLIERERFPRQKLCGEFISPECFEHFRELGVLDRMLAAGGHRIYETRFFAAGGRNIVVPTAWLGGRDFALSLSRAAMDHILLRRAKEVGVNVLEGTSITAVEFGDGELVSLIGRSDDGATVGIAGDVFVDATGRAGVLRRLSARTQGENGKSFNRPTIVGFKAHIANSVLESGVCEIYSFPGGYGGLSHVENGLSNLCFLIRAELVRDFGNDATAVADNVVTRNRRAAETLRHLSAPDWLAVSITGFGTKSVAPAANLFSIGDAAAFIDPFTGSGMVMAFESARLFAEAVSSNETSLEGIADRYRKDYRQSFSVRLRVCSMLRGTAFMPRLASSLVWALGTNSAARRGLAWATRH